MNIIHVNTFDIGGGAERIAWTLHHEYLRRGHASCLMVGHKRSRESTVCELPDASYRSAWAQFWIEQTRRQVFASPHCKQVRNALQYLAEPLRWIAVRLGHEDMNCPVTHHLLNFAKLQPDIVHCHNLHGNYIDLRVLPTLGSQIPVVMTLHDAWLFSGHCAHSFACDRWKIGCGNCPDITIEPAIRCDATTFNWQRKQRIFQQSRLHIATPSQWLMDRVEQSIIAPAIQTQRVIPHGIDFSIFHPAEKQAIRTRLAIPQSATLLLFTANSVYQNRWKDYQTLRAAICRIAEQHERQHLLFYAIGDTPHTERIGNVEIRCVAYQYDPKQLAEYYQAADVYLHAANAEVWGLTITEAMACGLPVVATDVGGIGEQLRHGETGLLVPLGDVNGMAEAVSELLRNRSKRESMGAQATAIAQKSFDADRMASDYLGWYEDIL
jgi:glycosyltransferase involved in cell wall biosynthesis